ncbi:TadE family protein (fragment) [Burkholderiales bacterium]
MKVVYAYELKFPLMKTVFGSVLCGIDSGVNAFGRGDGGGVASEKDNCSNYYSKGRLPITTYATVQMQSDAWQDDDWKSS